MIISNPFQIRKIYDGESIVRLADSIKRFGIIQPVGVRRYTTGKFEIVFGERRLRAAKLIDMTEIPCIVFENINRKSSCELAYVENLMRDKLDLNEKAQGIETLVRRFDMSRDQVCKSLSVYRDEMKFLTELLHLSSYEKGLITEFSLTAAQLRPLMKIENAHVRRHLMSLIAKNGVPEAGCERFIDEFMHGTPKREKTVKKIKPNPVKKLVLKDIRVFINSIDHAIDLVRNSGVDITCEKTEENNALKYSISIPNTKIQSSEKLFT
jgi:ParB family chromosome partitioning protein